MAYEADLNNDYVRRNCGTSGIEVLEVFERIAKVNGKWTRTVYVDVRPIAHHELHLGTLVAKLGDTFAQLVGPTPAVKVDAVGWRDTDHVLEEAHWRFYASVPANAEQTERALMSEVRTKIDEVDA